MGALHDQVSPRRHRAALPAVLRGKGQIVCTMGLVHQQRYAAGVADFRDGSHIREHALIGRAGQDDTFCARLRVQRGGHIGGAHAAVDAELRVCRRRQVMGRQMAQLDGVVDGLVAVAGRDDRTAKGCQGANARQQADGGAAHQIPAPPRAVQRRRAGHGVSQNAVSVVQVVRTVDLGQLPGIAVQPWRRPHLPLMPRHMQRIAGSGECF